MAVHFHKLRISEIKKETADCVSVKFEVPAELAGEFLFKEGQNITVRTSLDGEEIRRSYSLCTAPHEKDIKVAIKKVEGGLFSRFANETLKKGDVVEVLPPVGKFNAKLSGAKVGNYLAIAAGSGITPVISIIKHTLSAEPASYFTLIYGNRSRSSIIFFEELEALKNKYIQRFNFLNILSRERTESDINHGRIDQQKLEALQSFVNDEKQTGPASYVTVKLDGRSFDFKLNQNGDAILDAALKQGADLPYACKGGVCCTCRAKLVSGEVEMDVNYALEPEEVAAGFILTCQSHPRSENVVIDFDVK